MVEDLGFEQSLGIPGLGVPVQPERVLQKSGIDL